MDNDFKLSLEFLANHTVEAVRVLERVGAEKIVPFLERISAPLAAETVKLMEEECARRCLAMMKPERSGAVLSHVPSEIASLLLRPMEKETRETILGILPPEASEPIGALLRYPEGTAGSLMDPYVFTIPEDMTAGEALRRMKKHPKHLTDYLFVVNRDHLLMGMVPTGELALCDPHRCVSEIMAPQVERLPAQSSRRAILAHPGWRESVVLPVVDPRGVFLGAMSYQTLRQLEAERQGQPERDPASSTGSALGELYWLGLSGLLKAAVSAIQPEKEEV
jgi:magnesium transporter